MRNNSEGATVFLDEIGVCVLATIYESGHYKIYWNIRKMVGEFGRVVVRSIGNILRFARNNDLPAAFSGSSQKEILRRFIKTGSEFRENIYPKNGCSHSLTEHERAFTRLCLQFNVFEIKDRRSEFSLIGDLGRWLNDKDKSFLCLVGVGF